MASCSEYRSLKYTTDYSTSSQDVVKHMNDIYNGFIIDDTVSYFT